MQFRSGVGPAKRMGIKLIPRVDKSDNGFTKLLNREEMIVFQTLAFKDAKSYFYHIQPGCVGKIEFFIVVALSVPESI